MRLNSLRSLVSQGIQWYEHHANKFRFGILSGLIGLTSVAVLLSSITSCKSSQKNSKPDAVSAAPVLPLAVTPAEEMAQKEVVSSSTEAALTAVKPDVVIPGSKNDPALDMEAVGESENVAGPVVGFEVWQDDKPVSTILTGKQVLFKLTSWTRDTGSSDSCPLNPGIVQASWTVGSKPAADVQRLAGQDCRALDYSGMFTKEGSITVKLDVLSADGELASSVETFPVKSAN